ncbi:helix-turn-helix protein [Actinocorallia herbida]|uniref:Helix-turn-helix protein n=1 Tax=Actinocorallia herbida TaxID=58109 RepID=A0A3N1CPC7_9ACTN|nr:helix-turn-helix domain-containing protein [Actinocorallia herbida]ROO83177.1 helix-turn-helix protein [Actinocorallia herbida]
MSRMVAFRFTLEPSGEQEALLRTAAGASRAAYNMLLSLVKDRVTARQSDPGVVVPWSAFDLINAVNAWKRQVLDAAGASWHRTIPAVVFEEAAVDLARGLAAFTESRSGE